MQSRQADEETEAVNICGLYIEWIFEKADRNLIAFSALEFVLGMDWMIDRRK